MLPCNACAQPVRLTRPAGAISGGTPPVLSIPLNSIGGEAGPTTIRFFGHPITIASPAQS